MQNSSPTYTQILLAQIISVSSQVCFFSGECYEPGVTQLHFDSISSLSIRDLLVRMYILSNDDGSSQIVSNDFTSEQMNALNEYFNSTGVIFA